MGCLPSAVGGYSLFQLTVPLSVTWGSLMVILTGNKHNKPSLLSLLSKHVCSLDFQHKLTSLSITTVPRGGQLESL